MAIATYAEWERRLLNPGEMINLLKAGGAGFVLNRWTSAWIFGPGAGVAPTAAAVPARDIAGAVAQQNGGSGALRLPGIRVGTSFPGGTLILCDRLSHSGGLDATVTSAQTTNLPTAALTRYTDGIGVMCALEIYTQIGSTGTTVTVSYTNEASTAGQISPAVAFGGNIFREAGRMIFIPNVEGDQGFKSVESVTVLASTLTAGNFGVTLFKPLLYLPLVSGATYVANSVLGTMGGGLPEILDDACLWWIWDAAFATSAGPQTMALGYNFAED